ncbi:MAG: hypothetical protein JWQ11_3694 [Rhizobacter sp.]|nr:hypothetical protein [Rhizobacter sp.]
MHSNDPSSATTLDTSPQATVAFERLPAEGAVELVFVLFHGVGANASRMQPIADRLVREYPQAAIVGIDAPHPFDAGPSATGRQWFSVLGISEDNRAGRVAETLPAFIACVRAQQRRFELEWGRVALVGFSQGAIMSLEAVQAEPQLAGRVLAFGGRYATPPRHAPHDTTLHLFHGIADATIPFREIADAAERLVALGADVTAEIEPGIGHELAPVLMDKAIDQLRTFLPKKVWREAFAEVPVLSRVASSLELGGVKPTGPCH